jgi:hypothetical protein
MKHNHQKAHIVAVDMGYGHQRAASPLRKACCHSALVNANSYTGIPKADRDIWNQSRKMYEFFSRFKKVPVLGEIAWDVFDKFQEIQPFYPKRDLSAPTIQLKSTYSLIKKKKWGKHLIDKLAKNPIPIVSTFFIPAFMADVFNYPGEIYCLCTDTDVSRAWAPLDPKKSKIKYFAPNYRVEQRLKMYGVNPDNIFVTGFPLPDELVGGAKETKLRKYLGERLYNLDPKKIYLKRYYDSIGEHLGKSNFPPKKHHPLTIMFAIGGAGAQRELGVTILKSLKQDIQQDKIRMILVAGVHNQVNTFFKKEIRELGMANELKQNKIKIIFSQTKMDYFNKFDKALRHTDILWTKPSELSFYTALGIPIIMSEPIGSQEHFNRRWLKAIGSGTTMEDPRYTNQWLFDWLESGWFAEAAMNGFLEASTSAVQNIDKILSHRPEETSKIKTILQY